MENHHTTHSFNLFGFSQEEHHTLNPSIFSNELTPDQIEIATKTMGSKSQPDFVSTPDRQTSMSPPMTPQSEKADDGSCKFYSHFIASILLHAVNVKSSRSNHSPLLLPISSFLFLPLQQYSQTYPPSPLNPSSPPTSPPTSTSPTTTFPTPSRTRSTDPPSPCPT